MELFRKLIFVAALAGLIAGVFVTVVHQFATVPVILKAEVYEKAADEAAAANTATAATTDSSAATSDSMENMPGMSHDEHEHGAAEWEPADGFERNAFTVLADLLTGIGFSLLLVSAFALRGGEMNWRKGLFWGLAGFAAFTLAPGLGLPPEVPGTQAAPLLARQIWWVFTVAAACGGLACLFLGRTALWCVAGLALLVIPHIIGAPQLDHAESAAPESIAHEFIVAVVITSLVFWAALGTLSGYFYQRFVKPA
ncbi:MAG TPA: CbtA family protein [Hypericibacter adhaerens]|nr:CbtA family protein [Hypericibacter adhaerens]HWA45236.1 CbtA family protein [Hypericibacter adhaerens]